MYCNFKLKLCIYTDGSVPLVHVYPALAESAISPSPHKDAWQERIMSQSAPNIESQQLQKPYTNTLQRLTLKLVF